VSAPISTITSVDAAAIRSASPPVTSMRARVVKISAGLSTYILTRLSERRSIGKTRRSA
jgi:hypothetical protein